MSLAAQPPPRLQQSLEVLTQPTATDLLPVESVRARLKLGSDDSTLETLGEIVTEASSLVAGYLRYSPAYSPALLESVWELRGSNLYVSARPLLAVARVLDGAGVAIDPSNYALDRTAHSLHRCATWGTWGAMAPTGHLSLISGSPEVPDWRVYYSAGWWLETMAIGDPPATPPAGVPLLPPAIRRDFVSICRWLWWRESGAQDAGIASMKQEGAEVVFRGAPSTGAADEVDRDTGLPNSLTLGMRPLRKVT